VDAGVNVLTGQRSCSSDAFMGRPLAPRTISVTPLQIARHVRAQLPTR
jgi:hypothetical protein